MHRSLTLHGQMVMIDKEEAPPGFYPVPKDTIGVQRGFDWCNFNKNICTACDWRSACNGTISCMSYSRADGISVVFKKGTKI